MKKKLFLSVATFAAVGAACFAAFNTNTQPREFSDLELANIEALTQGEGTPVEDCVASSSSTAEFGLFYRCDDRTTSGMLYPCKESKEYIQKGVITHCTKKIKSIYYNLMNEHN